MSKSKPESGHFLNQDTGEIETHDLPLPGDLAALVAAHRLIRVNDDGTPYGDPHAA